MSELEGGLVATIPTDIQGLIDRAAIIDLVNRIGLAADARDWAGARACFAHRVYVDYTSLSGGEPGEQEGSALIDGWRDLLPGFDATQHVITNHQVRLAGDRATCLSHFRAQHRIGEGSQARIWELDGDYHHGVARDVEGWRVDRIVMTWRFEHGDRSLAEEAGRRAGTRAAR